MDMHTITRNTHELLTENAIKTLCQNRISNVLEFLTEDVNKISTLTKLTLHQVIIMRCDLLERFSSRIKRVDNNPDRTNRTESISTGINKLDLIVGGGIPIGYISEICGLAGSGKTLLCYTLLIRAILDLQYTVLFIDTKGDFSAVTIQKYLEQNGKSDEEMAKIMELIKVVRVWSMNELVQLLQQIKNATAHLNKLRLIIIDSLPCLMFQFLGDDSKTGLTLMNKFVNIARYLCKEKQLAMVCTNILTRWIEQTAQDVYDQEVISRGFNSKGPWVEKKYRCLGRYWQHIPALVLQLEMYSTDIDSNIINIRATMVKSMFMECGSTCILNLSRIGIIT